MRFYVIEIAEGNAKIAGPSVNTFDDLDLAIASFHSKLGTAMKSELYTSDLVMVVNSEGGIHRNEKFTRKVTEEVTE